MASLSSIATQAIDTGTTTPTFTLPAGTAIKVLFIQWTGNAITLDTIPSGYSSVLAFDATAGNPDAHFALIASDAATSDTSVQLTFSSNVQPTAIRAIATDWDFANVEGAQTDGSVDPPSLDATFTTDANTLRIAVHYWEDSRRSISTYPSNCPDNNTQVINGVTGAGTGGIGFGTVNTATDPFDPDAFVRTGNVGAASITIAIGHSGGAQTVSYGFGSETDTAQAFSATVRLTDNYGFGSEADTSTGFIATVYLTDSYGFGSETDTAFAFAASILIDAQYGFGSESNAAFPFAATVRITDSYAFANETNTVPGFLATVYLTDSYGFGTETDTAQDFAATVYLTDSYGFASETDTAQAFIATVQLSDNYGFGTEADTASAFSATVRLTDSYGFGSEADTSAGFVATVFVTDSYGFAAETDDAQAFIATVRITDSYGFGTETDTAQGFDASSVIDAPFGFGQETDTSTGFLATVYLTDSYGFSSETNDAQGFVATVYLTDSYGFGAETDSAQAFIATVYLTDSFGFGAETDASTGFIATVYLTDTYGFSGEADSAFAFAATIQLSDNYGFSAETDATFAFAATVFLTDSYGFAPETDTAQAFTATVYLTDSFGFGAETDASVGFAATIGGTIASYGFASETDTSVTYFADRFPYLVPASITPTSGVLNNTTGLDVALPTGIQKNEVIGVVASIDGTTGTWTHPTGFQQLRYASFGGATYLVGYFDSAEFMPTQPATLNWKYSLTEDATFYTFRVIADPVTNPPEISSNLTFSGPDFAPNPPAITPSGGSGNYLAITVISFNRGSDETSISAYPSGYINGSLLQRGTGINGISIAISSNDFKGTTEDPGAYTVTGTSSTGQMSTLGFYLRPAFDPFDYASEADSAFAFTASVVITDSYGFGAETDAAQPFQATVFITDNYGFGTETDAAQAFTASFVIESQYGFGAEADTAQPFIATVYLTDSYGFGAETDAAQAFQAQVPLDVTYGFGAETDVSTGFIAEVVGGAPIIAVYYHGEELDMSFDWFAPVGPQSTSYPFPTEPNVAFPFVASIAVTDQDVFYGFAAEVDTARVFSAYVNVEVAPTPNVNLDLPRWGCGEWSVWLADRDGTPRRQIENVTSISGSPLRIVDNVSKINISLGEAEPNVLCEIEPWASEIQVRLDGKIEWAGPVQNVDFEYGPDVDEPVSIEAADLLEWLSVRVLRGRIAEGPVSQQFATIINQAMAADDIGLVAPTEYISVQGKLRITDITSALDEIIDLAPFLDFTMLGRDLLVGGEEVPFTTLPGLILPEHARTFKLRRVGEDEASQIWMRGGEDFLGGDLDRAVGSYPPEVVVDPKIGVVQRREYDTSILEEDVAISAAYSYWKYAQPPVWQIEVTLDMTRVPFRFSDLIAGSIVPVSLSGVSCWKENPTPMRIRTVNLNVSSDEEEVTLDLIPAGILNAGFAELASGVI